MNSFLLMTLNFHRCLSYMASLYLAERVTLSMEFRPPRHVVDTDQVDSAVNTVRNRNKLSQQFMRLN